MVDDATIARIRARGQDKQGMRERYPLHAELTDWARAGGLQVASVTVDGITFGQRTRDAVTPGQIIPVSVFAKAIGDGIVQPKRYKTKGAW